MAHDPNSAVGKAPVDGVASVFALGALVASSRMALANLRAAVARLFGGGGLEAALREERALVKAQLLALAAIADGAITEAERPVIADFSRRFGFDPEEVLAKVESLGERLRDRRTLVEKIAHCATPLTHEERYEVFAAIEELARQGSAAWPEETGYRGTARPTPTALLTIFREALALG